MRVVTPRAGDATASTDTSDHMHHAAKTSARGRVPRAHFKTICPYGHLKTYVDPTGRPHCRVCNDAIKRRLNEAKRQERLRERRRRLAERPMPPKAERVWAAGHFEGEGTITIASGGRNALPIPRVSLTSTDKSVIDFFNARWPGYVRSFTPPSRNGLAREAFCWQMTANDAVEGFVLDILPHVQTERVRAKADLILEDIGERVQLRRTKEVQQRRWARMAKMRALNRRGIERPHGEAQGK